MTTRWVLTCFVSVRNYRNYFDYGMRIANQNITNAAIDTIICAKSETIHYVQSAADGTRRHWTLMFKNILDTDFSVASALLTYPACREGDSLLIITAIRVYLQGIREWQ